MGGSIHDLVTPALVVDADAVQHNLDEMSRALPGDRLRPHVKAHKCTELAKRQADGGHRGFTCATIREMEGMAAAGLSDDLLLANEVLDASRLGKLNDTARVTVAVDSEETVQAAARGGVKEVVVDVNVGMPRCGCMPDEAGRLADLARSKGLEVRGVMGYEGHVVGIPDRAARVQMTEEAMKLLLQAHAAVGGDLVSAGGTGTYDVNTWATEIQAGSYALMDTTYGQLDIPFKQALHVLATVIHSSATHAVANTGLKSFGMDHGNPTMEDDHQVFIVSDEHVTFLPSPDHPVKVGDLVRFIPAHIDPTVAYHERMHFIESENVVETWPVDLRGW